MFEEVCLTCSKYLAGDGSAYCSDECKRKDTTSPSSCSSEYSSPHLRGYAAGPEIPPLAPSALGHSHSRNRYSISSSSASSTTFSNSDEEDSAGLTSDTSAQDDVGGTTPAKSASASTLQTPFNPLMYYARRPSGTNNPSMLPRLLHRPSSSPRHHHPNGSPAAYQPSSTEDDGEGLSEFGYSEEEAASSSAPRTAPKSMPIRRAKKVHQLAHNGSIEDEYKTISVSRRSRNRGSLPAYFSLLQLGSPSKPTTSLTITSSSFHPPSATTTHTSGTKESPVKLSPPTPKLSHSYLATSSGSGSTGSQVFVRGRTTFSTGRPGSSSRCARQQDAAEDSSPSRSPRRDDTSMARSPSLLPPRLRLNSKSSIISSRTAKRDSVTSMMATVVTSGTSEDVDIIAPAVVVERGRAARRNISPGRDLDVFEASSRQQTFLFKSQRGSQTASPPRTRGRAQLGELVGPSSAEHPGLGYGRSGLLDRERQRSSKSRKRHEDI